MKNNIRHLPEPGDVERLNIVVQELDQSNKQLEADIALDKEMDRLYGDELGYSKEDVEMIKRHAFMARDRILRGLI